MGKVRWRMQGFVQNQRERWGRWLCLLAIGLPLVGCGDDADFGGLAGAGGVGVLPLEGGTGGPAGSGAAGGPGSSGSGAAGSATGSAGSSAAGRSGGGSGSSAGASGGAGANAGASGNGGAAGSVAVPTERFSFFVTSYAAMQRLSKSMSGFGGDLRYGESDGLKGADKICTEIAEASMPGSGAKGWRAFLSVTKGPDGNPVHAIDRIGEGPWYDRRGRLLAMKKADLLYDRPMGADPAIVNDFPNEDGVPNHAPDGGEQVDNHDMLTGTNDRGQLYSMDWSATCHDWTSAVGSDGKPRVGHSWPRNFGGGGFPIGGRGGFPIGGRTGGGGNINGANWMSSLDEAGCAPGASLIEMGPPNPNNPTVGSGGGYGGIYCFALMP